MHLLGYRLGDVLPDLTRVQVAFLEVAVPVAMQKAQAESAGVASEESQDVEALKDKVARRRQGGA